MTAYQVIERLNVSPETREMAQAVKALTEHAESLSMALEDAICTYREDDKTVLVSAERQEAWIDALAKYRGSFFT